MVCSCVKWLMSSEVICVVCVREVAYELRGRLLRKRRQKRPSLSPARAFLVNKLMVNELRSTSSEVVCVICREILIYIFFVMC